jgi:hypothetical protein
MGSPVSVVLAELMMQSIEKQIFDEAPYRPLIWKRYIDDIITIIPERSIDEFLNFINTINPHI